MRTRKQSIEIAKVQGYYSEADYSRTVHENAKAAGISVDDAFQLLGIELACEVADAWAKGDGLHATALLPQLLNRLEAATRGSALRKVRP